ncbi:MAG: D-alanyl-D-alanine carboxypeptidase/D-alanyl-D-alanine-endopeptidase [Bdellovibrionota bacterium]
MRHCSYVIFVLLNFFSFYANASTQDFPKLERLQNQGAKVSALVVNLNSGNTIAKISPEQRLSPASVSKLIIGADALETWGAQKTFSSQILKRGTLQNHVLQGDLIFYGGGDPSLTNEKLWFLTTDVARYGITQITGKVIVNKSLFGDISKDENRKAGSVHSKNAYDAPLSSAAVNFSVLALVVTPSPNGEGRARIALEPYAIPSVKIINNVTTRKSGVSKVTVTRESKNGFDTFTVSGNIVAHSPMIRVYRSISNPDQYAGEVINAFLNKNGIKTPGDIRIETTPVKTTDKLVSEVQSYPLAWQLRGLFEVSNNFIADMLTLNLGLQNNLPLGDNLLKSSAKNLEHYMKEMNKTSSSTTPIVLHSGSGLTPENRLSAKDVVTLLSRMYSNTHFFPEFLSALAIPGEEGTLKHRFQTSNDLPSKLMLRAKTGTLTEPFDVVALAGYSQAKNGDWLAFTIIVNGSAKSSASNTENIRQAIDSDLSKILAMEQQ